MTGIQFFDYENKLLLQAGYWTASSEYKEHWIELDEDDRIIGFKSE